MFRALLSAVFPISLVRHALPGIASGAITLTGTFDSRDAARHGANPRNVLRGRATVMNVFMLLLLLLVLGASAAFGQIEAPRLGLVVDGARIQTVVGVPGVAVVVPLRDLNARVVVASPTREFLLAAPLEGAGLLLLSPDGRVAADRVVLSEVSTIDAIVFSPRGSGAALRRGNRVYLVSGLPQKPEITRTFDLSFAGADVPQIAISDDASTALAVLPSGAYRLDISGVSRVSMDGAIAGAFLQRTRDFALAAADRISIVRDGQVVTEIGLLGPGRGSLFTTSRFAVLADRDFTVIDLASSQAIRLTPDEEPSSFQAADDVLFYLTKDGWSALDLSEPTPRLVRVPKRFVPEPVPAVAQ